ncbi:MAG: hypothetical protein ACXVMS_11585 [Flavisolibacter sp.]
MIKQLMQMMSKGTKVYYVKGNQNELLRKFEGFALGSAVGYGNTILPNRFINFVWEGISGEGKDSLSKKIKNNVKKAVSFISDFEQTAVRHYATIQ